MLTSLAVTLLVTTAGPVIEAGPLRASVIVAETPQLFDIVDQLSGWTPYSHPQFRRYFSDAAHGGLSQEDEALLKEHAALRHKLGYGALDISFYTELPLEAALKEATRSGRLKADEVEIERRVLTHFRPRVVEFLHGEQGTLDAFVHTMQTSSDVLRQLATAASRFFGGTKVDLPIYLVASPGTGSGGGFNGGRLVVEVTRTKALPASILHELWHAFGESKQPAMLAAARSIPGLDFETVSEGLAYAVSPGIYRFPGDPDDFLAQRNKSDLVTGKSFFDEPYVRFNRLGLALRPTLQEGLRDGTATLESILPIELALYRGLAAIEEARSRTNVGYFVFGPEARTLARHFGEHGHDAWGRDLQTDALNNLRSRIRPQDVVVLLIVAGAEVPPAFQALLGEHWALLSQQMVAAPLGSVSFAQAGAATIIAAWAPTPAAAVKAAMVK